MRQAQHFLSALTSDDDIHLLIERDPVLMAQEQKMRDAVGVDNSTQFFVVRGETPEVVLERAEALGAKLDGLTGAARLSSWQSVTSFVPSAKRQGDDHTLLSQRVFNDPAALRAMLVQAGFRDEVADGWLAAYAKPDHAVLTVDSWLAAPWSQPFRHLWLGKVDIAGYAAVVIPQGVTSANEPALIATAHALPGVSFVDKAASVSTLFGAYRVDSGIWLAGALLLVLLLMMARYRPLGGIVVTLPVLLAVGVTRGWRSTLIGMGLAGIGLVAIILALGPALTIIPIEVLRLVVGALLLVFGISWQQRQPDPVIAELWQEMRGVVSVQVLQELYVTLTRKTSAPIDRATARELVRSYASWLADPTDLDLVLRASEVEELHRLSFWDALIVTAAAQAGVSTLLSEDLNDGQVIEGVKIENPFRVT